MRRAQVVFALLSIGLGAAILVRTIAAGGSGLAIGYIFGVGLMALRLKGRRDEVPFGPMLVVGTFIAMLFGESLLQLYLRSLGMATVVPSC